MHSNIESLAINFDNQLFTYRRLTSLRFSALEWLDLILEFIFDVAGIDLEFLGEILILKDRTMKWNRSRHPTDVEFIESSTGTGDRLLTCRTGDD